MRETRCTKAPEYGILGLAMQTRVERSESLSNRLKGGVGWGRLGEQEALWWPGARAKASDLICCSINPF